MKIYPDESVPYDIKPLTVSKARSCGTGKHDTYRYSPSDSWTENLLGGKLQFRRCRKCGFVQVWPLT